MERGFRLPAMQKAIEGVALSILFTKCKETSTPISIAIDSRSRILKQCNWVALSMTLEMPLH